MEPKDKAKDMAKAEDSENTVLMTKKTMVMIIELTHFLAEDLL